MNDNDRRAAVESLFENHRYLVDIGQPWMTAQAKRRLDWAVKHGIVVKRRALWPWITVGTVEKTFYFRADDTFYA